MKIHRVGAELFYADRRTDIRTDMLKLAVSFRNFENAPKNCVCFFFFLIREDVRDSIRNLRARVVIIILVDPDVTASNLTLCRG